MAFDGDRDDIEFSLYTQRLFRPGDAEVAVQISGRIPRGTEITFDAYRISDPSSFFLAQQNPHSPSLTDPVGKKALFDLRDSRRFKRVATWQHRTTSRDRWWSYEQVRVPVQEKGVYLVQASGKGKVANTVLIVTELGLIVKQARGEAMAFAVSRTTGQRQAGMDVVFARGASTNVRGTTGSDGVVRVASAKLDAAAENGGDEWSGWGRNIVVMAQRGEDFAISDSYFYTYGANGVVSYIHTDRPVYRPGQTVYIRGILRKMTDSGSYANLPGQTIRLEITDARGASIKKDSVRLSDLGTWSDSLVLGDEPPLGNYTISGTALGESFSASFAVEEYKKPEYEVRVNTDKPRYIRGDAITATVDARYYFGSPVTNADVQYAVYRSRYWMPWWYGSRWSYLYDDDENGGYSYGMEMIHSGSGKLGADGTLKFTVPAVKGGEDADYVYRVQATVTDASRRAITGSSSVKMTRGEFMLTAHTAKYVYRPGDDAELNVKATPFEGTEGIKAPFTVKVTRTWWEDRRGWHSNSEEVWKGEGTTEATGGALVRFPVKQSGYYTAEVVARDLRGTAIRTSTSIYVADRDNPWSYDPSAGAQIIPDKEIYSPGDMLTALVILPATGADMLVTSEGAAIYNYSVERLGSTSAVIRVPVDDRHVPGIFLNVGAIVNDDFRSTQRRIAVSPEGRTIRLSVVTDRAQYRPGDEGTVTVRAVDAKGRPVANADVALGVVDEALYAIRPDATTPIEKAFYGPRYNTVSTNTSLTFSFWNSAERGGRAAGAANMAAPAAESMSDQFAARKSMARDANDESKEEAQAEVQPVLRKDFRDLMYWTPSVRTGADGTAKIPVTFPDNLTTWRITARGVTAATEVGQTTAQVIARKELLVRMETPRFIIQGDQLVIATNVHNYLKSAKSVRVKMEAEGVELLDRERSVTIPPEGEARVDWKIKAPATGTAVLRVSALTNEESDAMEMRVPILPQGVASAVSTALDLDGEQESRPITLTLPGNADPKSATMTVKLSPSAAGSMLGALDELIGYPYGCVEQTMSRFLPTVVVADALQQVSVPFDPEKKKEIPKMVKKGLDRLYTLQHDDGGWGWWEHDETHPFMTAYVIYGLATARLSGQKVDADRFSRGVAKLRDLIEKRRGAEGKQLDLTTEAYMLYALSTALKGERDKTITARITRLAESDNLNNYALALLALTAHEQGEPALASRYANRLAAAAQQTATIARWPGQSWHYNWQDDEVETSAYAVKALLAVRGEDETVRKGVRWLLGQKRGDAWGNTRQTAMVCYALVDVVKRSHELDPDFSAVLKVNGRTIASHRFSRKDIFSPEVEVKIPAELLHAGDNTVTVEKQGKGRLYTSARMNFYATGSALRASSAGFAVERQYFILEKVQRKGEYIYERRPYTGTVKSGQELLVKVRVTPESRSEYVMVEDPLPAGCEVITDASGYVIPGENGYSDEENRRYRWAGWNWWYADRDVRDEKVTFFATTMDARPVEFTYLIRAQIPGTYSVMPTTGALMYYPEVRGNSASLAMAISDR